MKLIKEYKVKKYIIAIDEGTTSERAILYDTTKHKVIRSHSLPISTTYPKLGYVEQNAEEIWEKVKTSISDLVSGEKLTSSDVIGIAITNQREAVVAFNKTTGKVLAPIISWQCKRTADFCENVSEKDRKRIKDTTGLILDSYFSATKMAWLLANNKQVKSTKTNELALCTIDAYLVYKLSNGAGYYTDTTNASRTLLVDITNPFEYSGDLLKFFGIKKEYLPKILNSADNFGMAEVCGLSVPILSIIGDQQSSLFGQGCFTEGSAKMTYGTGGFFLMNNGNKIAENNQKLLNTVAYSINGKTTYAIEGSIFNVGSCLNFVKNQLSLFEDYNMLNKICTTTEYNGVNVLPTFTGIGAPYWNPNIKASITGLTLGSTKNDIVKATIDSFAFSLEEILSYLRSINYNVNELRCDGGVSKTEYLLIAQANTSKINVLKMTESESTSMGAIYLALVSYDSKTYSPENLQNLIKISNKYSPKKNLVVEFGSRFKAWHESLIRKL